MATIFCFFFFFGPFKPERQDHFCKLAAEENAPHAHSVPRSIVGAGRPSTDGDQPGGTEKESGSASLFPVTMRPSHTHGGDLGPSPLRFPDCQSLVDFLLEIGRDRVVRCLEVEFRVFDVRAVRSPDRMPDLLLIELLDIRVCTQSEWLVQYALQAPEEKKEGCRSGRFWSSTGTHAIGPRVRS